MKIAHVYVMCGNTKCDDFAEIKKIQEPEVGPGVFRQAFWVCSTCMQQMHLHHYDIEERV